MRFSQCTPRCWCFILFSLISGVYNILTVSSKLACHYINVMVTWVGLQIMLESACGELVEETFAKRLHLLFELVLSTYYA